MEVKGIEIKRERELTVYAEHGNKIEQKTVEGVIK